MCGNVGIINNETNWATSAKLVKFFQQALHVDALRGVDGTGLAAINMEGEIAIYKSSAASQEFLDKKVITKTIADPMNQILCGHNRWATTGSLTDESAHPFQHGDITLFHNGTLDAWSTLTQETFEIDSEAICAGINQNGAKATLEQLQGAYALVWYNSKEETLNFARNKDRPLYFGTMEGTNSIVYASEKGMIEWLAGRNDLKLKDIKGLETGKILSIYATTNDKPKITDFKVKELYYNNWNDGGYGYNSNYGNKASKKVYYNEKFKYDYLDRHIIQVQFVEFCTYQYSSNPKATYYGYAKGIYTDCLGNTIEMRAGGKSKTEVEKLIKQGPLVCRVVSTTCDELCYVVILNQTEITNLDLKGCAEIVDKKTRKEFSSSKKDLVVSSQDGKGNDIKIVGPNGLLISETTFNILTDGGCTHCSVPLSKSAQHLIFWAQGNNPYCTTCAIDNYLV